ncbi:serine hydrolase [Chelatococcus reniformis]|uniref:Serine hydrolase n=1 Tax=Chelatococcus reniformis TaxID=1494448 RepID=A0A916XJD8_9HYPH|nr:serine hydrolase [Chelatococcus reniformis]GGC77696.1 serine hydrolase [Chelatococcus reniformis]
MSNGSALRRMLRAAAAVAMAVALLFGQAARAEAVRPEQALAALFAAPAADAAAFAPGFLARLPAGQVTQIVAALRREHGSLGGVEAAADGFTLRFARARIPARISLDADGRIAGLWFGAAEAEGDLDSLAAAIRALPGRTSVLVITDGRELVTHEASTPLAVGSAAKLAILAAVQRAVAQARLAWDAVVKLDPGWRSLPTGQLQDWPEGTPLTVATLAHLMVSISDNTATDTLIRLVGREAVEALSPRNAPFATTRELFILKAGEHAGLRREWRDGDGAGRRALLEAIAAAPLPRPEALSPAPTPEVAWVMTAGEVCALLEATADLPSVGINSGPADRGEWRAVAYKGGSDVGVLNLSSRLVGRDGRVHCVVATWNGDGALDEGRLIAPYRGLIARLAGRSD